MGFLYLRDMLDCEAAAETAVTSGSNMGKNSKLASFLVNRVYH